MGKVIEVQCPKLGLPGKQLDIGLLAWALASLTFTPSALRERVTVTRCPGKLSVWLGVLEFTRPTLWIFSNSAPCSLENIFENQ